MNKQLYETFSDKTLREWCLFTRDSILYRVPKSINIWEWVCWEAISWAYSHTTSVKISGIKILWHEPTIVDVFKKAKEKFVDMDVHMNHLIFFSKNPMDMDDTEWMFMVEYDHCKSLLEQSDETIQSLINIFEKCN